MLHCFPKQCLAYILKMSKEQARELDNEGSQLFQKGHMWMGLPTGIRSSKIRFRNVCTSFDLAAFGVADCEIILQMVEEAILTSSPCPQLTLMLVLKIPCFPVGSSEPLELQHCTAEEAVLHRQKAHPSVEISSGSMPWCLAFECKGWLLKDILAGMRIFLLSPSFPTVHYSKSSYITKQLTCMNQWHKSKPSGTLKTNTVCDHTC